jgi:hypothetical protein
MAGQVSINHNEIIEIFHVWRENWQKAKAVWTPLVKLREPIWCNFSFDAHKEGLKESFAMIRLKDHRIVIDLEKVKRSGVEKFAVPILAHEIGHHIYTPANLHDNAVLLSRIRWGLADIGNRAPFVANIYADLLINDKLQRSKGLDMASVYKQINKGVEWSEVWMLFMRIYEYLWKLKRGTLAGKIELHSSKLDADASLAASLIRSYAGNWLEGATRFAALLYPYLIEDKQFEEGRRSLRVLLDSELAGEGSVTINGLAALDEEAVTAAIDPRLEALEKDRNNKEIPASGLGTNKKGGVGPRNSYVQPGIYIDLLRQVDPSADEKELLINYYREIALPHLISFPLETTNPVSMTLPEGVDNWDISDPIEEIDWLETALISPQIIPGFNTRKRIYGPEQESSETKKPLDVYIGIDCSGSMMNPRFNFSWPVLASTIIGLSALRAGAKVMSCLSGEPGSFMETNGFSVSEKEILTVLTSYLGTGYAYGIPRLNNPFSKPIKPGAHIVLVTDNDIFSMLSADTKGKESNWKVIERALQNAGGSGTLVLHSMPHWEMPEVQRLQAMGWRIYYITNEAELLDFASEFSKVNYQS